MSYSAELHADGLHLHLEVIAYENAEPKTDDDANWLSCRVKFEGLGFSATLPASMTTHDFIALRSDLRACTARLSGRATLEPFEEVVRLSLDFEHNGVVVASGALKLAPEPTLILSFSFSTNVCDVSAFARDIDGIVDAFPLKLA